jgi:hypothetical protein
LSQITPLNSIPTNAQGDTNLTLNEYLALPAGHIVDFTDGQKLLADIAKNDLPSLTDEQAQLVKDYISVNLLHKSVSPNLVPQLDAKLVQLENSN